MTSEKTFRIQQKALGICCLIAAIVIIILIYMLWSNELKQLLKGFIIWIVLPVSLFSNLFFFMYFIFNPQDDDETPEEKREFEKYRHWSED